MLIELAPMGRLPTPASLVIGAIVLLLAAGLFALLRRERKPVQAVVLPATVLAAFFGVLQHELRGTLRITAPPSFGPAFLNRVCCRFMREHPQVQQALQNTVLLQADVTANSAQDVALLKHLQVLGLPTILFFDEDGNEQPALRVTGFMDANAFRAHLRESQP